MDIKLESRLLVELTAVLSKENNNLADSVAEIFMALFKKKLSAELKKQIDIDIVGNTAAFVYYKYGKTNPDSIKNKYMIANLFSVLWLYYNIAVNQYDSPNLIKNIIEQKIEDEKKAMLIRDTFKTVTIFKMFFSREKQMLENAVGMLPYIDFLHRANTELSQFFNVHPQYKAIKTIYKINDELQKISPVLSKPTKKDGIPENIGLDIIVLIAATQDSNSLYESCVKVISKIGINFENTEESIRNKISMDKIAKVYWENNVHAYQNIKNRRMIIDLLRKAWFYLYLADNTDITIVKIKKVLSEKFNQEKEADYLSEAEINNNEIHLFFKIIPFSLDDKNLKDLSVYINKFFYDELYGAYKKLIDYFAAQGFAFKELTEIYALDDKTDNEQTKFNVSNDTYTKTGSMEERESELLEEIEILENKIDQLKEELVNIEINTVIALVRTLNAPKFLYPIDSIYNISKGKYNESELKGVALSFINAMKSFGIKLVKEEILGQKAKIMDLEEGKFRKDIHGDRSSNIVYVSPGYQYNDDIILPVKVRQEKE